MPTTNTHAAEQPEPTLRDVLVAVNGLGGRMDRVEQEVSALGEYSRQQFSHLAKEIADVRHDVSEVRRDLTEVLHDVRLMQPQVDEAVRLGRVNRDMIRELKGDVARMDAKIDQHRHDPEIHVPRPRESDAPELPAAA